MRKNRDVRNLRDNRSVRDVRNIRSVRDIRSVYILLTHTGTIPSRIIKAYTREPFSHVSISFREDLTELYSFGRKRINNPLIGGFVCEDINKGLYLKFINTHCALYKLRISEEQYINLKNSIDEFKDIAHNYRYNILGLLAVAFNIQLSRNNAYFCSQFAAEMFRRSGIKLFEKPSSLVKPSDFRLLDNLELIYEGKLKDYNKINNFHIFNSNIGAMEMESTFN